MVRVCVIGAGPAGMSFIREVKKLQEEDSSVNINLVCYEKQSTWGGQWNFSWRTGVDEFGETAQLTMNRELWSNTPRETIEFPDYPMVDHFKKNMPSYLPREAILHYITGYWKKNDLDKFDIRYNHVIKNVKYDSETDKFKVIVLDLKADETLAEEIFDYVINCGGHFSVPSVPSFKGMETFPNTVVHTAHLKTYDCVEKKRVLIVGSKMSAEDCVINSIKYGAESVIVSYRSRPMNAKVPDKVTQRPTIKCINSTEVTFIDDSTAQVDIIILATGYLNRYPFMTDELRYSGPNNFFNEGFHHGSLWKKGGNNKLFYIGGTKLFLSFRACKVESRWCSMYIGGKIKLRSPEEMEAYDESWLKRMALTRSPMEKIKILVDWWKQLAEEGQLDLDMDVCDLLAQYFESKNTLGLEGYKNVEYRNLFTGTLAAELFKPYMEIKDCSHEELLSHY